MRWVLSHALLIQSMTSLCQLPTSSPSPTEHPRALSLRAFLTWPRFSGRVKPIPALSGRDNKQGETICKASRAEVLHWGGGGGGGCKRVHHQEMLRTVFPSGRL